MALTEHKTDYYHYFTDKQGRRQGESKWWYDDGQLMEHCFFVDDKRHGEYRSWYDNGQPCEYSFFVDGRYQGEFKWWFKSGQPDGHGFFVDDEQVMDFLEEPEKYPKTPEGKILFALKYGTGKFLDNPISMNYMGVPDGFD